MLPSITGTCDRSKFYIIVKYGSRGPNFQTVVGARPLTPELAEVYNIQENATHFHLVVPYTAEDSVFEVGQVSDLQTTLNCLDWITALFCFADDNI